jgi:hypothetical protein
MSESAARSRSPYDRPLSALRQHVESLAVWEARTEPDAHARRCASNAVDAIDAALRKLHSVRQELITEIMASDDASAARTDALLERRAVPHPSGRAGVRRGRGGTGTGDRGGLVMCCDASGAYQLHARPAHVQRTHDYAEEGGPRESSLAGIPRADR